MCSLNWATSICVHLSIQKILIEHVLYDRHYGNSQAYIRE